MTLPQLPADKGTHFFYGALLFTLLVFPTSPLVALGVVVFMGIAKEVYDKLTGTGTPEVWDVVATAAGGLFGYLCTWS